MININEKEIIQIETIMNKITQKMVIITIKEKQKITKNTAVTEIILIKATSNRMEIIISIKTRTTIIVTKIVTTETMKPKTTATIIKLKRKMTANVHKARCLIDLVL